MPGRPVKDWLSEYKALPESELTSYANAIRHNEELVDSLYEMFEDDHSHEILDPVCHQLFNFYRSGHSELQRFTIEAMPVLISAYLSAYSRGDKKRSSSIEACLLGVYNAEVIGPDGKPKVHTYTIPTLAIPSVYHETSLITKPPSLATLALTDSTLQHYHSENHVKITVGPLPHIERIHSQNRMLTLTKIINVYNDDIVNLSPRSHYALCKVASRLTKAGFGLPSEIEPNMNDSSSSQSLRGSKRGVQFRGEPRISLSAGFLVEILNGVYFAMFNGQASEGIQAVEDIHRRASYELYPDVLLVTNATKNSLLFNPSGQPKDGPMGISIALSPTQASPAFSKSAITNASFRTKKLPEDIDVPEEEKNATKTSAANSAPGENMLNYEEAMNSTPTQQNDGEKFNMGVRASGGKMPKPLKGIMKKGSSASEKADKVKSKKDDAKKDRKSLAVTTTDSTDNHSPKNPKHSISMSTGLSHGNGHTSDIADPNMVGVQVVRSSSSGVTGRSIVDYVDLKQVGVVNKRSSTISEDSVGSASSYSHSRDHSASSQREQVHFYEDEEADEDLDTPL